VSERIRYHTDLRVWQLSREIVASVYEIASRFPVDERFALADQVRRCAVSIPANIAEGCGRGTTQELIRSLRIARGSLSELHSHLTIAVDLGYVSDSAALFGQIADAHLKLNCMIGALQRRAPRG
jgi:four helix bundle protein